MSVDFIAQQKHITIKRQSVQKVKNNGRKYLIAYQDNMQNAMGELSHSAFKIYIYLLFNKSNFTLAYSPEHISKTARMCKETARKALKQLLEKGYLIQTDKYNYDFYEVPILSVRIKAREQQRQFVDNDTGEVYHYTLSELKQIVGDTTRALALWEVAKLYEP